MIHTSLNYKDQIGALIRAKRLCQYLKETVVAGIELMRNICRAYA
jgi:hypothetical protein